MNLKKTEAFLVGNQDDIPISVNFNDTGDKMFVVGSIKNTIFQYDLSEPYNLNTAKETTAIFNLSEEQARIVRIAFSGKGDRIYIIKERNLAGQGERGIFQHKLNTPYDLNSINPEPEFCFEYNDYFSIPEDLYFDPSGKWAYITDRGIGRLNQYVLAEPFNLQTAQFIQKKGMLEKGIFPSSIAFDPSGKILFVTSGTYRYFNTDIYQYHLSTPYDISTAAFFCDKSLEKITNAEINGLSFNKSGTALYVVDSKYDQVSKIELFSYLEESKDDKGRVTGAIPITIEGHLFSNLNQELINHVDYEITNLPEGFIPHIRLHNDLSSALLILDGHTLYHTENFSIERLEITFNSSAFKDENEEVQLTLPGIVFYGKAPSRIFELGELVLFLLVTFLLIATLFWFKRSIRVKYIAIALGFILLIAYDFYVSSTYGVQMLGPYNIYYRVGILLSMSVFVGVVIQQSKRLSRLTEEMKLQIEQHIYEITDLKSEVDGTKAINELRTTYDLSVRELEILDRIVKGVPNKQIADELFISTNTVKFHVRNLYSKLGISSRKEAAEKYLQSDQT